MKRSFNVWVDDEVERIKMFMLAASRRDRLVMGRKLERMEEIQSMWRGSMEYAVSMQQLSESIDDFEDDQS